jgi:hypothetical protein
MKRPATSNTNLEPLLPRHDCQPCNRQASLALGAIHGTHRYAFGFTRPWPGGSSITTAMACGASEWLLPLVALAAVMAALVAVMGTLLGVFTAALSGCSPSTAVLVACGRSAYAVSRRLRALRTQHQTIKPMRRRAPTTLHTMMAMSAPVDRPLLPLPPSFEEVVGRPLASHVSFRDPVEAQSNWQSFSVLAGHVPLSSTETFCM